MADFFQTQAWWDFQRELGEEVVHASGDGWHYFGRMVKDAVGTYLYLPYGPVVASEQALDDAVEHAKVQARELGAYRLLLEPSLPITPAQAEARFATQRLGFQPSRSQIVHLAQSEEDIIKGMSTTRRKQHRGAERKGMTFSESRDREDYETGVRLLRESGEAKSFFVRDEDYFDKFRVALFEPGIAKIFVGRFEGDIHIVAFVIDDADTRYYLYVGRDLSNNSLQISAPLISHMILDAKAQGLKEFDLFGISASDDVEDDMTGFTVFKRTFGGETVQYAGTWEIPLKVGRYAARRVIDTVEKLRHARNSE